MEHEFIPLNFGDYSLLIINTNKPRILAESGYNQRRKECTEALEIIAKQRPIMHLVDATDADFALLSNPIHVERTRHAASEQQRVLQAKKALTENDFEKFGQFLNESHTSLRDDFEVSCAELDFIVSELQSDESCLGARMTGAGFGGCCVAIVRSSNLNSDTRSLILRYTDRFGYAPTIYQSKVSVGVHKVS
ncbi:MAG: hypothetical protein JKX84_05425 [Flavobacteriales bacterium]|nr:hypothetical protein [Flavobacteriales bacterium]